MAIHKYGPSRVATFYVGLRRGKAPRNRKGHCATFPDVFSADIADRAFLTLRAEQVGNHVGLTRYHAEGWWESEYEPSAIYQVIHIPSDDEPDPESFVQNMEALAEQLAKDLCQDEVFLVYDDSHRREGFAAEAVEPFMPRRRHRKAA